MFANPEYARYSLLPADNNLISSYFASSLCTSDELMYMHIYKEKIKQHNTSHFIRGVRMIIK